MLRTGLLALLCLLVLAPALPAAAAPGGTDRSAIERQIAQWLDGYNTSNIEKITSVFSPDLMFMTADAGVLNRDTIAHVYEAQFSKYHCHIVGITDEIQVSGNMAYDRGHFTITLAPKAGGATVHTAGSFLETWRKDSDGTWRVTRLASLEGPSR
jgi:uncharacterized protein (TIGR02246 family)